MGPNQTIRLSQAEEIINKTKRQLTEWEKMWANDVTDKALISKIYKQLILLNNNKTNNQIEIWTEDVCPQKLLQRRHTDSQKAHEENAQYCSLLEKCKSKLQ